MARIPTHNHPRRIGLKNGGAVHIKRIAKRSTLEKIVAIAGLKDGDTASQMRASALIVRAGIVAAEGLTDPESGAAVEYRTELVRPLGTVASVDVYDAIPADDLERVTAAITGDDEGASYAIGSGRETTAAPGDDAEGDDRGVELTGTDLGN